MGLKNGETLKETKVILEGKNEPLRVGQEWLRGTPNGDGWFTLKNPISGRYLNAVNNTKTAITGRNPNQSQTCMYPLHHIFSISILFKVWISVS